jgi:hypothetical protein
MYMKDFRTMKRQRGRNRKPSGQSHNPNRAYESGGPEGIKVRGNAQTVYEKYQQLARDANASGDRVLAEAYLQHAEHYFRLIRLAQPQRPVSEFVQRDPFSTGYEDYDDDIIEAPERPMEARSEQAQPYDRADDNRDSPRDFPQREFNREQSRDQNRDFPRERDGSSRRETRRERYERKKQQRFSQGPDSERGDFELTRFEPSALAPTTPITPPAIASTQPLQAASQRTPVNEPRMVEARPATQDANALPDFIRVPSPAQQTVFESEPHTKNGVDFDDTAAPKPRKPRGRPKAVISDESHQTEA